MFERACRKLFLDALDLAVKDTVFRFVDPLGDTLVGRHADGRRGTAPIEIQVRQLSYYTRVMREGNLGMGEAYINREFEITVGTLEDFITALLRNRITERIRGNARLLIRAGATRLWSYLVGKAPSVRCHYDLGPDLFQSFLDPTLTYSCGYQKHAGDDSASLQQNKLDRICQKLRLQPGHRVLDIGCGFGGLLNFAASNYQIEGLGISNSRDHVRIARERIQAADLGKQLQIEEGDYSQITGQFDRIVSVGMMEHVPRREYRKYVGCFRKLLKPDGLALIHTIGCITSRNDHDPFIQRYVFPGSNQPKLSEIALELERQNLPIHDVENLARHYYHTTRAWMAQFRQNQSRLDPVRYPDSFQRMWEYYLACCIAACLYSESALFQVLFSADFHNDVPLIRI